MTSQIDAVALTTFDVAPDGSQVRLHVQDRTGAPATLVLPSTCVNQLLMTLPRMVQTALRASHGDDSLRLVYPLEHFTLEMGEIDAQGERQFILTLKTGGGFSVAFSAAAQSLACLGRSIIHDVPEESSISGASVLRS